MRVGIVLPHIFMHKDILPHVIFSPGRLAIALADGLQNLGASVTLFTPGPVDTKATNVTADLSYFEQELALRGDTYLELLKKHLVTFVTLSRQVQSELLAKAFAMANNDELDIVHIYSNEEDNGLPFSQFCKKPVVFTHHDPFNFLIRYKNVFPKYKHLNWLSLSNSQRLGMPKDTNWVGTIYHGIAPDLLKPNYQTNQKYLAYFGRIISPKGVHLAILAVQAYNKTVPAAERLVLKIAGQHYAHAEKDLYWQTHIAPHLTDKNIDYVGFITKCEEKQTFLADAKAIIIPSTFEEPFGMVMIEALACGTPIIGLNSGAIPEVVTHKKTGFVIKKTMQKQNDAKTGKTHFVINEKKTVADLANAISQINTISRKSCRKEFEKRFTSERMCKEHLNVYTKLTK